MPLSHRAIAVLREAWTFRENDLVFPTAMGRSMSDSTLSKLLRELGIGAAPHGFRSTFRDWCREMTNAPREVAAVDRIRIISTREASHRERRDYESGR